MSRGYRLRLWFLRTRADRRAYRRMTPTERLIVRAFAIPPSMIAPTR